MATNTLTLHIGQDGDIPSWLNLDLDSSGNLVYSVEDGDQITLPNYNMVIKEGYVLGGWSETKEGQQVGTSIVFTSFYEPTSNNRDLYPVWVEKPANMRVIDVKSRTSVVTTVTPYAELQTEQERTAARLATTTFKNSVENIALSTITPTITRIENDITTLGSDITALGSDIDGVRENLNLATRAIDGLIGSITEIDQRVNEMTISTTTIRYKCTFVLGTVKDCYVTPDTSNPSTQQYRYVIKLDDYRKRSQDYTDTFGTVNNIAWYNNGSVVTETTPIPNNSILYGNRIGTNLNYYVLPTVEGEDDTIEVSKDTLAATNFGYTVVTAKSTGDILFDSKKSYNNAISQSVDNIGETVYLNAEPKDGCKFLGWYEIDSVGRIIEDGTPGGKIVNPITFDKTYETAIDIDGVKYAALFLGEPTYEVCSAREFVEQNNYLGVLLKYYSDNTPEDNAKATFIKDFVDSCTEGSDISIPDSINYWDKLGVCTEYNKGEFYNAERDEQYNRIMLITNETNVVKAYISSDNEVSVNDWYTEYDAVKAELSGIQDQEGLTDKFDNLLSNIWPYGNKGDERIYIFDESKLSTVFNESDFIVINITPQE